MSEDLKTLSISPEDHLEPYHTKLIRYIEKNGYINDKLYSKLTDRAKATRSLDFNKLINLGIIERLGKGRGIYYKLKQ